MKLIYFGQFLNTRLNTARTPSVKKPTQKYSREDRFHNNRITTVGISGGHQVHKGGNIANYEK